MVKVKCIDNVGVESWLTIDGIYYIDDGLCDDHVIVYDNNKNVLFKNLHKERFKTITDNDCTNIIQLRCTSGDDNICEKIMPSTYRKDGKEFVIEGSCDCTKCNGGCKDANDHFSIIDYGDYFTVRYYKKIGDIVIDRCSERIDRLTLKQI